MFYRYYRKKSLKLQTWLFILSLFIDLSIWFLGRQYREWRYCNYYSLSIIIINNIVSNFFYTLGTKFNYWTDIIGIINVIQFYILYTFEYYNSISLIVFVLSGIAKQFLHYHITTNPKKIQFIGNDIEYMKYQHDNIFKPYKISHVSMQNLSNDNKCLISDGENVFAQSKYLVNMLKNSAFDVNKNIKCLDGDPLITTINNIVNNNKIETQQMKLTQQSSLLVDNIILLTNSVDFVANFITQYHHCFKNIFIVTDNDRVMLLKNLNQHTQIHKIYLQISQFEQNMSNLNTLIMDQLSISAANKTLQDHKLGFVDGYLINKYNLHNYLNIYHIIYRILPRLTKIIAITQTSLTYTDRVFNLLKLILYFCLQNGTDHVITLNIGELQETVDIRTWQSSMLCDKVSFIDTKILSNCVVHLLTRQYQSLHYTHTALLYDKSIDTRVLLQLLKISNNISVSSDLIVDTKDLNFDLGRQISDNDSIKEIIFNVTNIDIDRITQFINHQIYHHNSQDIAKNIYDFLRNNQ